MLVSIHAMLGKPTLPQFAPFHCGMPEFNFPCPYCCLAFQVVDADTQKAMLAWYYKKQEEEKVRTSAAQ
jgi:hypothetical protein